MGNKSKTKKDKNSRARPLLIIDFCNIGEDEWAPETLLDLQKRHRIRYEGRTDRGVFAMCHSPGSIDGFSEFCGTGLVGPYFWLVDNSPYAEHFRSGSVENPYSHIPASPAGYDKLWEGLKWVQQIYKRFLDDCVRGVLDVEFLQRMMQSRGDVLIYPEMSHEDPWRPRLHVRLKSLVNLEDHIDQELISLCLNHELDVFRNLGVCDHCWKYFIRSRKDKKYCTVKCRHAYHNETPWKKDKKKVLARRRRKEGHPSYY